MTEELLKSCFMYEELINAGARNANDQENSRACSYFNFNVMFWLTHLIGLCMIILTVVWVFKYWGGIGWRGNPADEFNWHTLSMTIGFIYLFGNGMIFVKLCIR